MGGITSPLCRPGSTSVFAVVTPAEGIVEDESTLEQFRKGARRVVVGTYQRVELDLIAVK